MKRAVCLLRQANPYRRESFCKGLKHAGYALQDKIRDPRPGDVMVTWNKYGDSLEQATRFERAGGSVLVVENGYLGKDWLGGTWFALALGDHAGAGTWVDGGPERWDALGVELAPWRTDGSEVVILGQRGIGSPIVRSPDRWAETTQKRIGGRIRRHPDQDSRQGRTPVPFEVDLRHASACVTWASSAALRALTLGIPVFHEFKQWIGAGASRPLAEFGSEPKRDDAARLAMFRRLAWAQWRLTEIHSGEAFVHLLGARESVAA